MKRLEDMLVDVHDRDSFYRFVKALIQERRATTWAYTTVEDHLEASLVWSSTRRPRTPAEGSEEPSWRRFAEFLHAGMTYEVR